MNRTNRLREKATAFGYGKVDNNRLARELQAADFEISSDKFCRKTICADLDDFINFAKPCGVRIIFSIHIIYI